MSVKMQCGVCGNCMDVDNFLEFHSLPIKGCREDKKHCWHEVTKSNPLEIDKMRCTIDLSKTDVYEDNVVPDKDVEICLKVLRTIRAVAMSPDTFSAEAVLSLTYAHSAIHDMVTKYKKIEADSCEFCYINRKAKEEVAENEFNELERLTRELNKHVDGFRHRTCKVHTCDNRTGKCQRVTGVVSVHGDSVIIYSNGEE